MAILMFEVLAATSLGLWISAAAPTIEAANTLSAPCTTLAILFAGYYGMCDNILSFGQFSDDSIFSQCENTSNRRKLVTLFLLY